LFTVVLATPFNIPGSSNSANLSLLGRRVGSASYKRNVASDRGERRMKVAPMEF